MAEFRYRLYGDGIHDDLPAIQERLDTRAHVVYLPQPEKNYLISGTIYMHSNQELKLDRYTLIRLADGSSCSMIEDAGDAEWNECITVSGGIWDMNSANQKPNPLHFPDPETGRTLEEEEEHIGFDRRCDTKIPIYTGSCFRFYKIKGFYFGNITIRNPVFFGVQLCHVHDFTVENIVFDYKQGAPKLWNLDGIHMEGGCRNGYLRNLKGTCHDDTVAITSDDANWAPIENIVVDGVFAQNAHSAVRLLSRINPVRNIHITNIYGTFYTYAVIMSKFYAALPGRSGFENISIDNVYVSFCKGTEDVPGNKTPLIIVGDDIDLKNIKISRLCRNETHLSLPTISIGENTTINNLSVTECLQTNETGKPITFMVNNGRIDKLYLANNDCGNDEFMSGNGEIGELIQ